MCGSLLWCNINRCQEYTVLREGKNSLPESCSICCIEEEFFVATFYNQATLSYNGSITSSNITTGIITEVLSAQKNAVDDNYSADSDVVFIISIVNTGSTNITGLTITDDLGAYAPSAGAAEVVPLTYSEGTVTYYVDGVQQIDPEVAEASPLTITGISVPANGSTLIIYSARTNEFAPFEADASIVNTAVISGTGITDITVSETITPVQSADLTISKSLTPTEVEENGEVTYTFVIQNFGNTPAAADDTVIFRDVFDPVLSGLTAEFNGMAWAEGTNYTYDETTGEFVTLEGQITVPAAEFSQDPETSVRTVQPGVSILVIKGNI